MRIGATIQARTGSSRLPNKVLEPFLGRPMLARQIERIQQSRLIDVIVVATTDRARDDAIADLADGLGFACHRGSEDDVLDRVVGALRAHDIEVNVEFMGDNPLPDPLLIDAMIGQYLKERDRVDYLTNALTTTYPPGAEVTVYPSRVLFDAAAHVPRGDPAREHVGPHVYQHRERYRVMNVEAPPHHRFPTFHFEVDTPEDLAMVRTVFEALHPRNPFFGLDMMIDYLQANPEVAAMNRDVERRWREFRDD